MNQTPQQAPAGLIARLKRKALTIVAGFLPKQPHLWQLRLHGRPFVVWINETIGRRLFVVRRFEDADIAHFQSLLRPGETVLDVGGNIGLHAVAFATTVGAHGRVHSFEPFRRNTLLLALNAELNSLENIRVHQMVVTDQAGLSLSPTVPMNDTAFAYFSTAPAGGGTSVVPTTTLDRFVSDHKVEYVAGIKIDVEGAEYNVLKGASDLFSNATARPRFVMVEIATEHLKRFGHSYQDISSFFDSRGYEAFVVERGSVRPVPPTEVPDCMNVFFQWRSQPPASVS